MEKEVLIEKYKEKNIYYVYVYLDPRKPGEYIYFDDKLKLEAKFDYEPFYVGKGCGKRKHTHLSENENNTANRYKFNKIQKIIRETGNDPIVLLNEFDLYEQDAFKLEIKLIALIGRNDLKKGPLTNLTDGGEGPSNPSAERRRKMSLNTSGENNPNYGNHLSDESKEKIRIANSGLLIDKMISKYGKENGEQIAKEIGHKKAIANKKTILQYSIDGNFLSEHIGIKDTAERFNISINSIGDCVNGVIRYGGGFIWKLKEEENFPQKIEGIKNHRTKIPVLQYSLCGEFMQKWDSVFSAALYLNNNIRDKKIKSKAISISATCKGKYSQGLGFVWKYYDEHLEIKQNIITNILTIPKAVVQYDLNMNEINKFKSLTEAHKTTHTNLSSISMVCSGHIKTAGGFIWRYDNAA